mgnify:CR=1 FL=1
MRMLKTYEAQVTWLGSHPEPSFSVKESDFSGRMRVLNFSRGHAILVPADLALAIAAFGVAASWKIRWPPRARRWAWRRVFRNRRPAKRLRGYHLDQLRQRLLTYAIDAETITQLGTKNYAVAIDEHWTLRWNP